ncbi:MAG: hypothetical protein AAGF85_01465 [Bacteroidota bacterium]
MTNIFINTKQYGEAYESSGRDLAIDILFYPFHSFDITNVEGIALTEDIIEDEAGGNIGFRVVYDIYQIQKKEYTGKMFGLTFPSKILSIVREVLNQMERYELLI